MWMTPGEIITSWRQAKDPVGQVKILAELNGVSVAQIEDIMVPAGYAPKRRRAPQNTGVTVRKWTPEEEAWLKEMAAKGVPPKDIAARTDRSFSAIKAKMAELRLVGKEYKELRKMAKQAKDAQWTSDEVEYLLAKKKLGLTAQQIAGELGRTRGAVYAKLKELREKGKQIAAEIAAEEAEEEDSAKREVFVSDPQSTVSVELPEEEDQAEKRSYREDMQALSNAFAKVEESFGGCDRAVVYLTRAGATLQVAYGEMTVRVERYVG